MILFYLALVIICASLASITVSAWKYIRATSQGTARTVIVPARGLNGSLACIRKPWGW